MPHHDIQAEELRSTLNYNLTPKTKWGWELWKEEEIPRYRKEYGWLRGALKDYDTLFWGRWEYRDKVERDIKKYSEVPIPQIPFKETAYTNRVFMNLVAVLNAIPMAQWDADENGWIYFEYLCDWFLWALGHPAYKVEPEEPSGCKGAKYRISSSAKNIVASMIANPFDYLGEILYNSNLCCAEPFFDLPDHKILEDAFNETYGDNDSKQTRFPLPVLNSGRQMLHLSNYSLNICGQDIHPTLLKICQVQSYLYAPWVAEPIKAIRDAHQDFFWKRSLAGYILTCNQIDAFSQRYNLNEFTFEPNYSAKSEWFKYSPFCIVTPKFDINLLDPLLLNLGTLCKK